MRVLRLAFYSLLVSAIVLAAPLGFWFAVPSSLYFRQVSMSFEQDAVDSWIVTSVREVPRGEVKARWWAEIRVLGRDGFECHATGEATYQQTPNDTARFIAGAWAWPCLDAGPPLYIRYTRQVLLWNLIPLRPTMFDLQVDPVVKEN